MATLSSTTGTGHSPKGERKVAGILFLALFFAIVAAIGVYFLAGRNDKLNPYQTDRAESVAPDVKTETPGDRSGAVAAPQSDQAPVPESNSEPQNK